MSSILAKLYKRPQYIDGRKARWLVKRGLIRRIGDSRRYELTPKGKSEYQKGERPPAPVKTVDIQIMPDGSGHVQVWEADLLVGGGGKRTAEEMRVIMEALERPC